MDQGNNNDIKTLANCNYSPYGKEFMGGLKPTGRFTNAKTPIDIIAEELGVKEIVPAYLDPNILETDLLTGVSFASGASGYDPLTPTLMSVLSLSDQLDMFKEYIEKLKGIAGEERTNNILTNSIFFVVAGTVDFGQSYYITGIRKAQYDVPSYADLVVGYASNFLQEIYKVGARKIAVFGGPPLGCVPYMRNHADAEGGGEVKTCVEDQNQAVQLYNTKLSSMLISLGHALPQSKVVYINIYNPLLNIIQNPHNYGLDVVDKSCCSTGILSALSLGILCNRLSETCLDDSKYLFWDTFHPTEKGYRAIVDQILQEEINNFF